IKDCSCVLVKVPDFVRYGSKPMRDLEERPGLLLDIARALRTYEETVAYAPNQVFIGNMLPDELKQLPQPWYKNPLTNGARNGPFGEILPEDEFYAWLKLADEFNIVL